MESVYSCDLCKKVFKQKNDLTRHKNKKAPCISIEQIEKRSQEKQQKADDKTQLIHVFKNCLNILRDNEGLTGEKALRNMSYMLTLKLLEPRLGNEIDIENYPYDFSSFFEEEVLETNKKRLFSIIRFSNLAKEKEENIPLMMKYAWDVILSVHPTTKHVFLRDRGFDIQYQSTYKKLIDKIYSIDLSSTEYDVLGNAYEEVIQDIMTGKVLGQFFTPPLIKKMMIELISPKLFENGKIETCCDPALGTGGFLITYLKYIISQSKVKNINLDWEFIKNALYGKEFEPATYQLAVSNMLISSGHMFENLERGDSIREPITQKFDCILSNPPFGIKGVIFDDYNNPLKEEYTPIKTDKAVCLFLQAIIYMLKIGGRCAIVLPDGQELFSKSNKTLVAVREYLLKTCDLKEVICLPSGIFTYTSIKTCVFYFIKKKERKDALEVITKESKATGKIIGREYKFSKTLQTSTVNFYDFNPYENVKNLLAEVDISKIAANSYSLNYAEYREEEKKEEYSKEICMKTLSEICDIDYGTRITKSKNTEGEYSVYGSGKATFTSNLYNRDEFNVLIGRFALSEECVRLTNFKLFLNDSGLTVKPKVDFLLHKYIGYFLYLNQKIVYDCARGTAQKNLEMDKFNSIQIPIPCIQLQTKLVEQLDFIYEKAIPASLQKIESLRKMNEIILESFGKGFEKSLGEICEFKNGKSIKKNDLVDGEYPVIGGGQTPMGFHNEYNTNENTILCSSSGAYAGFISRYTKKTWTSDCFSIIPNEKVLNDYLYYYLKIVQQDNIFNFQSGMAQPHVYSSTISNIQIPIPPLSVQSRIVEKCEKNDVMIASLEKEMEELKTTAKEILHSILDVPSTEDHIISPTSSSSSGESSKQPEIIISEKRRGKKKA